MPSLFTKIVQGEIPTNKLYEDDEFIAILDIQPVKLGHTLLIPKKEYPMIEDCPADLLANLMKLVPVIGKAVMKATDASAYNLVVNNGPVAGQLIPHLHIHIIPRHKDDGLESWHGNETPPEQEMTDLMQKIRVNLQ